MGTYTVILNENTVSGRSLKQYLQGLGVLREDAVEACPFSENPSPSGDSWFDVPENMNELNRRFAVIDAGVAKLVPMGKVPDLFKV